MQRIGMLVGRPAAWQALRGALSAAGYDVAMATADPEPIDALLDGHDPDAVLVELGANLYPLDYLHARRFQPHEAKPLLVIGLARPEHLAPAHFVVGVDEFILPPYAPGELLARLQLALWRQKRIDTQHMVRIGGLTIDLAHRQVRIDGKPIDLSEREYTLLTFLASNRSRPFSRDALLRHVWGDAFDGEDRVVDRYVSRLRSKLGEPYGPAIETVRGLGYRLAAVQRPHVGAHQYGVPASNSTYDTPVLAG